MRPDSDFETLAAYPDPPVEELALAVAAELREPDRDSTLVQLDRLGEQLAVLASGGGGPDLEAWACAEVLGGRHGLAGDREDYDNPDNSMLDLVLERRRGLPILLSVVYVEVARRAGIAVAGVGLPGHFVCGHLGSPEALLVDPFNAGRPLPPVGPPELVRPWTPHETAMRMLNNLVSSYARRGDLGRAIHAADLRLLLPAGEDAAEAYEREANSLRARLN
jgi:regulator of sirC expression with transglutaminase-like and TPR domain